MLAEISRTEELLKSLLPSISGICYRVTEGFFMIYPPTHASNISPERLIAWSQSNYPEEKLLPYNDQFEEARKSSLQVRGGRGITARTVDEVESLMPGIQSALMNETGKVTFIGNGFSPIPLLLSTRYKAGRISVPPVVVDMIDYSTVYKDLDLLNSTLLNNHIHIPFVQECWSNVSDILSAAQEESLILTHHQFGLGTIPDTIADTSLALNCHGPNERSMKEQLQTLKVGGRLFTTYNSGRIPANYKVVSKMEAAGEFFQVIARIS